MTPRQFRDALTFRRNLRTIAASSLAVGLAIGCATQVVKTPPPHAPYRGPEDYTVLIDTDFSPEECARLIDGIDSWPTTLGPANLRIHFGRIRHGDILNRNAPTNWVYVARFDTSDSLFPICHSYNKYGCYTFADHHISIGMNSVPVVDQAAVAAHEFGHVVLGKQHRQSPSVMTEYVSSSTSAPTDGDIEEYCRIHGCAQ